MEIGANAVKAIRLERDSGKAIVSDFAYIPHKKVLTTPDLDQDEMVRLSLGQFISQKSLEGEHLVMSVPGHAAFARFAKLPPVEPKKIPDIVKFEAVQQIPFPIDEVEWDYQTFESEDSPEIEVGIFAITRDRVQQRLGLYGELGISPEALTLSPVAIYNAMAYDRDLLHHKGPVVFLDIGTQATDVIIAEEGRCWIRTFPLGGTHFTEAIANAFKLSYSKAEKLKSEASTSKYAKQIMQAMRPVFSDLLQDLQRSIGYYQSLHRENELTQMIGMGSTFKIPGLRKFIGQQLQINVVRLDEFKKISVTGREAAAFAEHAVNMATAYGLALQGVGLAEIAANVVPVKTMREQMWHAKTKWFAAAAAIIVAGAATTLYHPLTDRGKLEVSGATQEAERTLSVGERMKQDFQVAQSAANVGFTAENMRRLTDCRRVWPYLVHDVTQALARADPQPVLLQEDVAAIREVEPKERRLVKLQSLAGDYAFFPDTKTRRIAVTLLVELSHEDPTKFLNDTVAQWLRDNAEPRDDRADVPYRIIPDTIRINPTERVTFQVTEEGTVGAPTGGGSRGAGAPHVPRAPAAPPSGAGRTPPGSGRGAGAGPGSGSGGMPGRRTGGGQKRQAPGSGLSQGTSGTPGTTGPGGGGMPGRRTAPPTGPAAPGETGPGGSAAAIPKLGDLNQLAPMPQRPEEYPAGAEFYHFPVTFEIELVVPDATGKSAQLAAAGGSTGEKEA